MLGHLFYFFGLIILLLNLYTISKHDRIFEIREWMIKFKKVTGRDPIKKDYRKSDDQETLLSWSASVVITSLWIFFGLLSKSWYVFLMLLVFSTFINIICKFFGEFSKISYIMTFLSSLIVLLTIGFLIINHFHLHLDIWSIIMSNF